jgi:uncharacterized protein
MFYRILKRQKHDCFFIALNDYIVISLRMEEKIPDYSECLDIISEKGMLQNIKEHSILVMKVSLAITDALRPDVKIHRPLVLAGALLHDITKAQSLATHEPHDKTGGEYLRSIGLPSVAEVVEAHVESEALDLKGKLTEKEIVHYADKRVLHASIVSLSDRIDDLLIRYGKTDEHRSLILSRAPFNFELERKIESYCTKTLDEITAAIT